MRRFLTDGPILALMIAQTLIWAATFYSFPALVLEWQGEFGWSSAQTMGAFSLALAVQAISAPFLGRLIDKGRAPWSFPIGAIVAAAALIVLTQVQSLWVFYGVWAVLGITMGATLYDACFALVTRARDADARPAITAITLVAGFASTLAYPLTAIVSEAFDWQAAVWVLVALVVFGNLPLSFYAARRLEAEVTPNDPRSRAAPSTSMKDIRLRDRPEFLPLAIGLGLSALATAIVTSHLLPLMAALGVVAATAILAASIIGPSQVAGRILLTVFARSMPALPLTMMAVLGMGAAAAVLGGVTWVGVLVFGFAVLHGMCYGLMSILRPVVIRDILGQRDFGAIQGAVVRPSLIAFAIAPYVAALVADMAGYGAVLALCVAVQILAAICLWRVPRVP